MKNMNRAIFEGMSKDQKISILREAHDTGEPIEKIAAKWDLGTMAVLNDECKFSYKDKMVTPDEWRRINPLGEFGKLIIVGTKEDLARLAAFRAKQEIEKQ
jgi:hypothetical protein